MSKDGSLNFMHCSTYFGRLPIAQLSLEHDINLNWNPSWRRLKASNGAFRVIADNNSVSPFGSNIVRGNSGTYVFIFHSTIPITLDLPYYYIATGQKRIERYRTRVLPRVDLSIRRVCQAIRNIGHLHVAYQAVHGRVRAPLTPERLTASIRGQTLRVLYRRLE